MYTHTNLMTVTNHCLPHTHIHMCNCIKHIYTVVLNKN